jgi:hypothetical protein
MSGAGQAQVFIGSAHLEANVQREGWGWVALEHEHFHPVVQGEFPDPAFEGERECPAWKVGEQYQGQDESPGDSEPELHLRASGLWKIFNSLAL